MRGAHLVELLQRNCVCKVCSPCADLGREIVGLVTKCHIMSCHVMEWNQGNGNGNGNCIIIVVANGSRPAAARNAAAAPPAAAPASGALLGTAHALPTERGSQQDEVAGSGWPSRLITAGCE
jgi:hypothetical protein